MTQRDESNTEPVIWRHLYIEPEHEDDERKLWGTVRVMPNGQLEVLRGLEHAREDLLYSASLEYFAWSILWTWPPAREPAPPPGKRYVRYTFADGRVVNTVEPEPTGS